MSHLRRIWISMLTRNTENAGTDDRVVLIVNQGGVERLQHTFSNTSQDDQERGQANLYPVNVARNNIVPENLDNSSIRVGLRGDDAWRPEHFFVWGQRLRDGAIIPLAIETDLGITLSTDTSEGKLSTRLRRVGTSSANMQINRLLMLMITENGEDDGTDSTIELQITSGGALVVDFDIPDTPQRDQERGQANWYFVPVTAPFTKNSLDDRSIRLTIQGRDAWRPRSFFLFGLDDAAGRPEFLVPLVHHRNWPFGCLSAESSDCGGRARQSVPLSLV